VNQRLNLRAGLPHPVVRVPSALTTLEALPVTAFGRGVLAAGIAAWLAAWWLGWVELMVLTAACLLAVALSTLYTLGPMRLRASIALERTRVTVGESVSGHVEVVNLLPRRSLPARVEAPVGSDTADFDVPSLSHGDRHMEPLIIRTTRRSVIAVGPAAVVRGDPLGLARRAVNASDALELFVHPRTVRLPEVSSGWLRDLEGQATNETSLNDVAFHTLRPYVPGDDRRHVHWRTSARVGILMVRQFIDTRRSHLALLFSTRAADYATDEEFEMAVSVVASFGRAAHEGEEEVSCVTSDGPLPAFDARRLLDGLARVEMAPGEELRRFIQRALPQLRSASIAVVVTGSGVSPTALRGATELFGTDVRVLAIRCEEAAAPSFRHEGATTFLGLGQLGGLRKSIAQVWSR
jgi:uncharacterized protein (DUF58 family)